MRLIHSSLMYLPKMLQQLDQTPQTVYTKVEQIQSILSTMISISRKGGGLMLDTCSIKIGCTKKVNRK